MINHNESFSNIGLNLKATYTQLPEILFSKLMPISVKDPKTVVLNNELSSELGIDFSDLSSKDLSNFLSGNTIPSGIGPFAQAYAGHQFGNFTILGDGRALTIGEQSTPKGEIYDIQFKGSGRTPYSRGGDGRAALGPMLREYLISEAMFYLNIPTTRSLAVVETGEKVLRETPLKGAILTRVAASHVRFGTFQFLAAHKDIDAMSKLLDYCIKRHFPEILDSPNKVIKFIELVMSKQIDLIVNWMRVGFIHGVMNTDNSTICGETIDYGPCAFMDQYDHKAVFSSIDFQGRYAYGNQPATIHWNLVRLTESLLPLIDKDESKSLEVAQSTIDSFSNIFNKEWQNMMRLKLGLTDQSEEDEELIKDLLSWMQSKKPDFTNTFANLMDSNHANDEEFEENDFVEWKKNWKERVNNKDYLNIMKKTNPILIPRNSLVEEALHEAETIGKLDKFNELNKVIASPYNIEKAPKKYLDTPKKSNIPYKTFCGT